MSATRREPMQQRSRERVEQILEAAATLIQEQGLPALSTRAVAERAGVPVATLYRYFENSDAIITAFLDRQMELIDAGIAEAVLRLERVSLRSLTEAAALAHLRHHEQNPIAVMLWFDEGRSPAVRRRARRQDERLADWIDTASRAAGFVVDDAPPWGTRLLMRMADRMFEFALVENEDPAAREEVVRVFVEMVSAELQRFATPRGVDGIPTPEFLALLGAPPVHLELA